MLKQLIYGGGTKMPHCKNTAQCATEKMPVPSRIVVPMQQHIGAPCEPVVKKGDEVRVGTLLGKAAGAISADIHSGVSGTVDAVGSVLMPNGAEVATVEIVTDGKQTPAEGLTPPWINSHEDLVAAARACGLVGLGGAGFPTAVKLSPKDLQSMDTLIINGAECEPYITADNREFLENSELVIEGAETVKKHLNLARVIIAVERNKPEAMDKMFDAVKGKEGFVVKPLKSVYPQGAEKVLIRSATGRVVPRGKLPADVGVLVMNVSTVAALARYLRTGMPLTVKRITVDGDAVATPKNVEVIIGTPIEEVIQFCGGYTQPAAKVITGGPMMGTAQVSTEFPIIKQNNAVLVFSEKRAHRPEGKACIRCGRCIHACPMGLSPVEIACAYEQGDVELLNKLMVDLCIQCGTCTYVCPAKRPVTQNMSLAKILQKKGGGK